MSRSLVIDTMFEPRDPASCAPPALNALSTSTAGAALTGENVTSSDRHCSRSSLYIALPIAPTFDPRSTFSVLAWL